MSKTTQSNLLLEIVEQRRQPWAACQFGALCIGNTPRSEDHQSRVVGALQCCIQLGATGENLVDPVISLKFGCLRRPLSRPAEIYPTNPHVQVVGDHRRKRARDRGDPLAVQGRDDGKARAQLDDLSELESADQVAQRLHERRGKLIEQAGELQGLRGWQRRSPPFDVLRGRHPRREQPVDVFRTCPSLGTSSAALCLSRLDSAVELMMYPYPTDLCVCVGGARRFHSGLGGETGFIPADLPFDSVAQRGDRWNSCDDGKSGGEIDVVGRTNRTVEEC